MAHGCSKALTWGMRHLSLNSDSFLEDIHISVSALLRASTGLVMIVPDFIATHVVFDRPEPLDAEELAQLWTALDIEPKLIDLFMKVNPKWDGTSLKVSEALLHDSDPIGAVRTVLLYCLRFCDFSDTRWCGVGRCARYYMRALLVGVGRMVQMAFDNDAVVKWHLAGYKKRCTREVRVYLGVASLSARPSESMLLELFEDDRFLLHCDRLWAGLIEEHEYLLSAPQLLWNRMAEALGMSSHDLKGSVLDASLTSISYMYMDSWLPLTKPPYKYIVGDLDANLESLKAEDGVTDPVSVNMQILLLSGRQSDVRAACLLCREASLTGILVEQGHASGAQLMRRHPTLETASLLCRMTVHNSRTLFYPDVYEKRLAELTRLLEKIDKQMKSQAKVSSRNMYCKMLVAEVKASRPLGGASEHAIRRIVFKHHTKEYKKLGLGQLSALQVRVAAHVKTKVEDLALSKQHLLAQVSLQAATA